MITINSSAPSVETRRDERVVLLDAAAEQEWVMQTPGRPWFRCSAGDLHAADNWLSGALRLSETRNACADWAARRLGVDRTTVLGVSAPLHSTFAGRLLDDVKSDSEPAVHLCTEVLGWTSRTVTEGLNRWAAYAALLPGEALPLWIMDATRDNLEPALRTGDRLASAGVPLGLRVTREAWQQFTMKNESDCCSARWRLAPVLAGQERWQPEGGPDLNKRFLQALAPRALPLLDEARRALSGPIEEDAQSAVEALLIAVLEARPGLSGRFQREVPLDFFLGTSPAVEGLAAVDARLVIEIDGFHHHRGGADYRSDRRKDVLLQEHGWVVLRFPAEQVVGDMEGVIESIEYNLALRDAHRRSQKNS